MKELIIAFLVGCLGLFWILNLAYANADVKGFGVVHGCTGECYEQYVKEHGTVVEQLVAAKEAAAGDPFSSIRGLWAGCAACHGQEGQGMGAFPKLCLLYTSPSPRDKRQSRMPSSA